MGPFRGWGLGLGSYLTSLALLICQMHAGGVGVGLTYQIPTGSGPQRLLTDPV